MIDNQFKIEQLLKFLKMYDFTAEEKEDIAQELSELGYIFPEGEITNEKPF